MTEEERKYREELEKDSDGAIEIDENLDAAGNALQAFANELGVHEKSKKKRIAKQKNGIRFERNLNLLYICQNM